MASVDDTRGPKPCLVSVADLSGALVHASDGTRLGKISDLTIDRATGQIVHVLVCSRGLFGAGRRHILAWSQLRPDQSGAGFVTDIAPAADGESTDPPWTESVGRGCSLHDYYKARPTWDIPR